MKSADGSDAGSGFWRRMAGWLVRPLRGELRRVVLKPVRQDVGDLWQALAEVDERHKAMIGSLRAALHVARQERDGSIERLRAAEADLGDLRTRQQDLAAACERAGLARGELERRLVATAAELALLERLALAAPSPPRPAPVGGPPAVSVIMPTWQRARSVGEAIESVRTQTLSAWELLVVDDGSTDDTSAVLAAFAGDRRIRVFRQENQGASAARNRAIAEAQAPLLAFLDSDNLFYPGFLAAAVDHLERRPDLGFVYGALVTDAHGLPGSRILFRPFDAGALEAGNYIDMNTLVLRRRLAEEIGGFDPRLSALNDWDLVLRAAARAPGEALPVLAARYRVLDTLRLSDRQVAPYERFQVERKLLARRPQPPLRVLYLVWHYPQLSESYIETEIRTMRRWGVEVAVWAETRAVSPYPSDLPLFRGAVEAAVSAFRPDILHVHWLSFALGLGVLLQGHALPLTVRAHGFETSEATLTATLSLPGLRRLYAHPGQAALLATRDPRLRVVRNAFDSELFRPQAKKERRLVVRTSAALPSKDLPLFLESAAAHPGWRFVLAVVTCNGREDYVDRLREMNEALGGPVDLLVDVPRPEVADLVGRAGIYLHTVVPPSERWGTPLGMPVSLAEAMATGAVPLVRDLPSLRGYVGDAGLFYRDREGLGRLLSSIEAWDEGEWSGRWRAAVARAYERHGDALALRPIYEDWLDLHRAAVSGA